MEDRGEVSTLEHSHFLGKRKLDSSFVGKRIEYLSNFDMDYGGNKKELRWCSRIIEEVSDGSWFMMGNEARVLRKMRHPKCIGMLSQK